MTAQEMIQKKLSEVYKPENWNKRYGVRFDERTFEVGETLDFHSRDNRNREDERDFPEYGTDEYFEAEELNGVCAYGMDVYEDDDENFDHVLFYSDYAVKNISGNVYILMADEEEYNEYGDEGEVVLIDPVVIGKLEIK